MLNTVCVRIALKLRKKQKCKRKNWQVDDRVFSPADALVAANVSAGKESPEEAAATPPCIVQFPTCRNFKPLDSDHL
jgi:hypothetical protein